MKYDTTKYFRELNYECDKEFKMLEEMGIFFNRYQQEELIMDKAAEMELEWWAFYEVQKDLKTKTIKELEVEKIKKEQ